HEALEREGLAAGHLDLPAAGQRGEEVEEALDLVGAGVADARLRALDAVAAVVVADAAHLPLDGRLARHRPVTSRSRASPYFAAKRRPSATFWFSLPH